MYIVVTYLEVMATEVGVDTIVALPQQVALSIGQLDALVAKTDELLEHVRRVYITTARLDKVIVIVVGKHKGQQVGMVLEYNIKVAHIVIPQADVVE